MDLTGKWKNLGHCKQFIFNDVNMSRFKVAVKKLKEGSGTWCKAYEQCDYKMIVLDSYTGKGGVWNWNDMETAKEKALIWLNSLIVELKRKNLLDITAAVNEYQNKCILNDFQDLTLK
jgi:hypothetical protein